MQSGSVTQDSDMFVPVFGELIVASKMGQIAFIERYIGAISHPDHLFQQDDESKSALDWAISCGNGRVVALLVKQLLNKCSNSLYTSIVNNWPRYVILAFRSAQNSIVTDLLDIFENKIELQKFKEKLSQHISSDALFSLVDSKIKKQQELDDLVLQAKLGNCIAVTNYFLANKDFTVINKQDIKRDTLLSGSALFGQIQIVRFLLSLDPDCKIITEENCIEALRAAMKYGRVETVNCLLPRINQVNILKELIWGFVLKSCLPHGKGLDDRPITPEPLNYDNAALVSQLKKGPTLDEAAEIKKIYPIINKYVEARISEIQNDINITFMQYFIAIKYGNSEMVETYVSAHKKSAAIGSIIRVGLLAAVIANQSNIMTLLLNAASDVECLLYIYSQVPKQDQFSQALIKARIAALKPNNDVQFYLSYAERVSILEAANYPTNAPGEYECSCSHELMQFPIAVGTECEYSRFYDLASLAKAFLHPITTPEFIPCWFSKAPIKIDELKNGVALAWKNQIKAFVEKIEGEYAQLQASGEPVTLSAPKTIDFNEQVREQRGKFFELQNKKRKLDAEAAAANDQAATSSNSM